MYIVLDKISGEEIHRNPAPQDQKLSGVDVYYLFDENKHVIVEHLPEHYKMINGLPVELTLTEKIEKGIIILPEKMKIEGENIVNMQPFEYMTLSEFKEFKIKRLSRECKDKADKIFPVEKQINVLVGASDNYPEYLKGDTGKENIKRFIEIYKSIYSVNKALILACTSNEEIENIKINFPSESDILQALNV